MSSDSKSMAEAARLLQQLQGGRPSGMAGLPGLNGPGRQGAGPVDPKQAAFQTEMLMAQQALRAGSMPDDPQQNGALAFDGTLFGDSALMEALGTIARLTGQDGSGQAKAAIPAAAPAPELEQALTRNPAALGSIAAQFESGAKGPEAIGYDRTGGTSYGTFQISSRAGTMNRFLNYLAEQEPAWAARLRSAGPANTGSTRGRMPEEWARIAQESPQRFERLQHEFIKKDHYQPAREKIREQTGLDIEATKPALREALFSTAVQHGATGAARIFGEAIDRFLKKPEAVQASGGKGFEQALVSEVYQRRQSQFGGSTEAVRASVRGRLQQEKQMVLAMLDKKGVNRTV